MASDGRLGDDAGAEVRVSFARVKYFYNRCDPLQHVPADDEDEWYVDFDGAQLRGESCMVRLLATVALAEGPTTQLFTGFSGAGKTSELVRLRQRLEADDYFVVLADSLETIDPNSPIEFTDILLALAHAVDVELARDRGGASRVLTWARRLSREVGDLLVSDVAIQAFKTKTGLDPVAGEIGVEIRHNPSFREVIRRAGNNRRGKLLDQVRDFFEHADAAVRKAGWVGGLVVILDNLEKLSGAPEVRGSALDMFRHHVDALRTPPVHLIYTLPPELVFARSGALLGRLYSGEPLVLPMVRLWSRDRREEEAEGLATMRELVARRVDLTEVFAGDEALLDRLVRCSGGYPRDLLRLVQYGLQAANSLPVAASHVSSAISSLRLSYQRALATSDLPLLTHVRDHRPLVIPDEYMSRVEEVVTAHFVMVYANHQQWYDLHPVVVGLVETIGEELPVEEEPPSTR